MPVARLIATAPTDDPERTLLLFCPEQGDWQTGLFFEGRWLDFATLTVALEREAGKDGGQQAVAPLASRPFSAGLRHDLILAGGPLSAWSALRSQG